MPDKHLNFDDLWVAGMKSWRLNDDYVKEIGRSSLQPPRCLSTVDWIDRLQSSKVVIAVMAVHYRSGNNDVWAKVATHEDQRLQHCPHFCCSLWSHKIGEEEPFTFSSATSKGQPWHLFTTPQKTKEEAKATRRLLSSRPYFSIPHRYLGR